MYVLELFESWIDCFVLYKLGDRSEFIQTRIFENYRLQTEIVPGIT